MAFATPTELSGRLAVAFTPEETARAAVLLDEVSALMLLEMDWAAEPEEVDEPRWPLLRMVALGVAARWWSNPLAIASEVIGDYSYRLDRSQMTGLDFSESERKLLRRISGRGAITSVRVVSGITSDDQAAWSPYSYPGWSDYR
ncbi:hypothetical protein [Glycomyces buryatensis]|uniref:Uncharacterized protein n=1 Tax=Glycomyces buryatensis TaxID=2570927 RepID=A0A4S8QEH8_9ACTN|nr:hypothetical protein [Glycomyces buryatensis]THV39619.1 hypothetical protein FAB82_17260 [Glycomyces buryatensis]